MNQSFISGAQHSKAIAVSGSEVYWSNTPLPAATNTIGHASLDGTGAVIPASVNQAFISGVGPDVQMTAYGGYLYFDVCHSPKVGFYLVCNSRGHVVNSGQSAPRANSETLRILGGRATLSGPTGCVAAGRKIAVQLVLSAPKRAHLALRRVTFSLGRGRPVSTKHRPHRARLRVLGPSHSRLKLRARLRLTARHRHLVTTITMTLSVC